ncbi:conserved hypothetical protein [Leishmania infantum JPCM5]|uniref:Uncharacterized protein n=3 Tax=Leishmania donovani species complex TaxID=38574 RepID=A4I9T0_LEIIN|nr:conserved hypothetical protein [Leishmania infantum JPCM5]CAC9537545.1 hypothetical_protein_-_conserved [Leishmania infantum]CAM71583.1 conserved hypothetical protein [Leishmania infantum JPCM5]SUZ45495.1 hypothetical_protein_-_conserved [Leishmania infantum]VDZ48304.1 hypothetical_protein_conserved [Leishmania donovani]|eukprot:XP_001468499.1 conserved hypothetical protein [Leishmania infantum JPCM5]
MPGVGERTTSSDTAAPCKRVGNDVDPLLPHVCTSAQPLHPFPSIEYFEAARRAALVQAERRAKAHRWSSTEPTMGSGEAAATASVLLNGLVPSGSLLAQRTYRHDYEGHRCKEHMGATAAAPPGDAAEQTVGSLLKDSPKTPPPSPQLIFPSPVLLRAVAQLVLTLQASASTSAARFTLAQYRDVQLLPWRRSLHEAKEPAASSAPRRFHEAVVVSVLPQVVADCVASRARAAPGQTRSSLSASVEDGNSATLYALTPSAGPSALMGTRGAKRAREEAQGETTQEGKAVSAASAAIVPGAVLCERLSTTNEAPRAQTALVRYAAVCADAFERWVPPIGKRDASPPPTPSTASCVPETFLYEEESAWMTDGIFYPLFSLPLKPLAEPAVVAGGNAPAGENNSSGQSTANVTFVKTSAFLFLSFLVHRSWCAHVHSAVTQAMAAHQLPSKIKQRAGSLGLTFTGTHVTRLPPVREVRRSPQYEWRSALVYRVHGEREAERAASNAVCRIEGDEGVRGAALAIGIAAESLLCGPVLWQLTVLVVNRNAQLQWCMHRTSLATCVGADSAATSLPHDAHKDILEGSGTLDDLLQRL